MIETLTMLGFNRKSCTYDLFFQEEQKRRRDWKVNDKHSMLIDECENDEEEDYEMKHHKMKKEVSCSAVKMKMTIRK